MHCINSKLKNILFSCTLWSSHFLIFVLLVLRVLMLHVERLVYGKYMELHFLQQTGILLQSSVSFTCFLFIAICIPLFCAVLQQLLYGAMSVVCWRKLHFLKWCFLAEYWCICWSSAAWRIISELWRQNRRRQRSFGTWTIGTDARRCFLSFIVWLIYS